ncbi:MAG: hypothetical protein K6G03_09540, partial [Lachnospiraceae bacterium]|nr:hypothetical protein [Lachnospiraceae bacterium]
RSAAYTVAQSLETSYIPLYIFGGSGTGKTHLTYAIGNYINEDMLSCFQVKERRKQCRRIWN